MRMAKQATFHILVAGLGLFCLLTSGCIAQKADLVRIQKDLESRITKLDLEKKVLEDQLNETNERIEEEKKLQSQLKSEMKDMFRAKAEIRQELKALREADLTTLIGDIEKINFRIDNLQQDLTAQASQADSRLQDLQTQITKQGEDLSANQAQTTALIQQVDQDGQSISNSMAEFQTALSAFKVSMSDIGNKLVTETERASNAETELDRQLNQGTGSMETSLRELQSNVALLQQNIQTHEQEAVERLDQQFQINATNLQEVSQSVAEMRMALEQSGSLLGGQVDQQADQVVLLQNQVNQLGSQVSALGVELNQTAQSSQNQTEQMNTLQGNLNGLESQVQSESVQVQELNHTVVQLREALDVMGNLLGKRGDDLVQRSGRLSERLNQIESYQSELGNKLETNTQTTSNHLAEVNASVSSVAQTLQNTSENLAARVNEQQQLLTNLSSSLQELQGLKEEVEASKSQFQSAIQSTNGVQDTIQQVSTRIQQLETHQSGLVGKLDKDSQANLTHINQLTETVNKLRSVVNTIATKMGGRVDKHEERLAELGKRVNSLQGKKKPSKKK